jgi:phage terminase small subunit
MIEPVAMDMKLSPKQAMFVKEYLVDFNATQAAIRAGYSERTARAQGQRLLTKVDIHDAIEKAGQKRANKLDVTVERIVLELARIAFADPGEIIQVVNGRVVVKDTSELTEDQRRVVAEVTQTDTMNGGSLKVKLHDKQKALELLGRYQGMFIDRHEHSGPGGGPIQTEDMTDAELAAIARAGR